jgi:hypothetical protein
VEAGWSYHGNEAHAPCGCRHDAETLDQAIEHRQADPPNHYTFQLFGPQMTSTMDELDMHGGFEAMKPTLDHLISALIDS